MRHNRDKRAILDASRDADDEARSDFGYHSEINKPDFSSILLRHPPPPFCRVQRKVRQQFPWVPHLSRVEYPAELPALWFQRRSHVFQSQEVGWMLLICFVRLRASGTSVWQEHKVYANYTQCPNEIQGFPYGLSPTYRLPSLNFATAPCSASSDLA